MEEKHLNPTIIPIKSSYGKIFLIYKPKFMLIKFQCCILYKN